MTHPIAEQDLFGFTTPSYSPPAKTASGLIPLHLRDANRFVAEHHRHHQPIQGHKFSIGLVQNGALVGVAIVGRPVSRAVDDGLTAEVTRLCTDGTKNACSRLYAAGWRAARAMGYRRMVTYIFDSESGVSLKAAGWQRLGHVPGKSWNRPNRFRLDKHPLCDKRKYGIGQWPA